MKKILCSFIAAFAVLISAPSHATFGPERDVAGSNLPSLGSQFPVVAYFNNIIHVAWEGYAPGNLVDIYYARSTDNGSTWSTPVNISGVGNGTVAATRPQIAASALGVFVAWNMEGVPAGELRVRRSADGGATFPTVQSIALAESGRYIRLTAMTADASGNIHVGYYSDRLPTPASVGMARHLATCNGTAWGTDTAVTATAVDGDVDNEEPTFTATGGKVYATFRSTRNGSPQAGVPPYSVQVQSGTFNAGTCSAAWSYPARRVSGGLPLSHASSSRPFIYADGTGRVHLTYWDMTHGDNVAYRFGTAGANGLGGFSAPVQLSNFSVDHPQPGGLMSTPSVAAGGFQAPPAFASNGTAAYVAFHQVATITSTNSERGPVVMRDSPDNGVTWNLPTTIVSFHGATPDIAVGGASNQNLAIVWADDRTGVSRIYHKLFTPGVDPFTTQVQSVITSFYNSILLRAPDAPGMQFWTGEATRVVNLGADVREVFYTMSITFFNSPEYLNRATDNTQYLTDLYQTFFSRAPDSGGLAFWLDQMAQGMDRSSVLNNFLFSPEFVNTMQAKFGTPTVRPEVNLVMDLYRGILANLPDDGGFAFYVGLLRQAQCSGSAAQVNNQVSNIASAFVGSQQYANIEAARVAALRNKLHVSDLYNTFLRRGADIGGYNFYVNGLNTNQFSRAQLRAGFVSSTEFQNRVAAVIGASCMPAP